MKIKIKTVLVSGLLFFQLNSSFSASCYPIIPDDKMVKKTLSECNSLQEKNCEDKLQIAAEDLMRKSFCNRHLDINSHQMKFPKGLLGENEKLPLWGTVDIFGGGESDYVSVYGSLLMKELVKETKQLLSTGKTDFNVLFLGAGTGYDPLYFMRLLYQSDVKINIDITDIMDQAVALEKINLELYSKFFLPNPKAKFNTRIVKADLFKLIGKQKTDFKFSKYDLIVFNVPRPAYPQLNDKIDDLLINYKPDINELPSRSTLLFEQLMHKQRTEEATKIIWLIQKLYQANIKKGTAKDLETQYNALNKVLKKQDPLILLNEPKAKLSDMKKIKNYGDEEYRGLLNILKNLDKTKRILTDNEASKKYKKASNIGFFDTLEKDKQIFLRLFRDANRFLLPRGKMLVMTDYNMPAYLRKYEKGYLRNYSKISRRTISQEDIKIHDEYSKNSVNELKSLFRNNKEIQIKAGWSNESDSLSFNLGHLYSEIDSNQLDYDLNKKLWLQLSTVRSLAWYIAKDDFFTILELQVP